MPVIAIKARGRSAGNDLPFVDQRKPVAVCPADGAAFQLIHYLGIADEVLVGDEIAGRDARHGFLQQGKISADFKWVSKVS